MYDRVAKPKENKGRTIVDTATQKKGQGQQGLGFVDNRPEAVAQKEFQGQVAELGSVVQRKEKGPVTDKAIRKALGLLRNKELREELYKTWKMLQSGDHEVVFDDDFAQSRVVPDKETGRIKVVLPWNWWETWNLEAPDTEIDRVGTIIHELTHVAEIAANTKGSLDVSAFEGIDSMNPKGYSVDVAQKEIDALLSQLDKDKKDFKALPFFAATNKKDQTLYGYVEERLLYAYRALDSDESTYEVPTVVNQILFAIDYKGNERREAQNVWGTKTKDLLVALRDKLGKSRAKRLDAKDL